MLFSLAIVGSLLVSSSHARVTFANSEVIDHGDLLTNQLISFKCPSACKVYTPSASNNLQIINSGSVVITYFKDLQQRAVDNPLELQAGTYNIFNPAAPNPPNFVLYVVYKGANNYNTRVYTSPQQVDASNQRYVTYLNDYPGLRVWNFAGAGLDNANPRVYAAGFDSLNDCNPVFTARSSENAKLTSFIVNGPICTVDFGSDKGVKLVQFGYEYLTPLSNWLGTSTVIVSPGYVGCKKNTLYTSTMMSTITPPSYTIGNPSGVALKLTADYSIPTGSNPVQIAVNDESIKLSGTNRMDKSYDGSSFKIDVSWKRVSTADQAAFTIQIDNLAKAAASYLSLFPVLIVAYFTL